MIYEGDSKGRGEFRRAGAVIVGRRESPPSWRKIGPLMAELAGRIGTFQHERGLDEKSVPGTVLQVAVDLYCRLGWIHPFEDGNGRTARLAMNHLLRRFGLGYVIFPPLGESSALWEALHQADRGDPSPLIELANRSMVRV
jgi:Fic family protein